MENHRCGFLLIFSTVLSLGFVSFILCVIAESRKAKKEDLRLDNRLCYVPESRAFGFGIAALVCLAIAQIIGNLIIFAKFCLSQHTNNAKAKRPTIATSLLALSWLSFAVAIILLGAATSMSRKQGYGQGWLDQQCYLVKDGVYVGSGILVLITVATTLGSASFTVRKAQVDQQDLRIHAQLVG